MDTFSYWGTQKEEKNIEKIFFSIVLSKNSFHPSLRSESLEICFGMKLPLITFSNIYFYTFYNEDSCTLKLKQCNINDIIWEHQYPSAHEFNVVLFSLLLFRCTICKCILDGKMHKKSYANQKKNHRSSYQFSCVPGRLQKV